MDGKLNKEILRLSIPSILANLTVPLVGFVDTGVAGHLQGSAAVFIGSISIGVMMFNLLYWNFGFLRTGTGGLTAQAFGRRDMHDSAAILTRGLILAISVSIILLAIQWPFSRLILQFTKGSSDVEALASRYFLIRIWAAPATLSLMVFSGWFIGMQDSMSSMWKDLIVNGVNVGTSIFLSLGAGKWKGIGFDGIALGTVISQYCGLFYCILKISLKYRKAVFSHYSIGEIRDIFNTNSLRSFFSMNTNLFFRSMFFTCIYIGYTILATEMGDMMLACSSITMQLLLIFSYFTDGFAYAGEALSGRFIGEKNLTMFRRNVRYTFSWSMGIGLLFILIYFIFGDHLIKLMTNDNDVIMTCRSLLPWLMLMPPVGCAAFFWDGIYLGSTASKAIRNTMFGAAVSFFAVWIIGKNVISKPDMNLLLAAYFAHLIFRTVHLSSRYKKDILKANFQHNE